jgi:hypothetical protein
MMPKTVNSRVGEKVSGLHRVMATEQKQNLPSSQQNKLRLESPTPRQTATRIDERIRVRDLFECECYLRYPLSTISGVIKFIVDSDIELEVVHAQIITVVGRVGAKASGVQQVLTIVAREQTATQEVIYWNCIRDCLSVKVVSDVLFGFWFIFSDGDRTETHFTIVIPEQTAT